MGIHSFRAFQLKNTYLIYEKEIPSCIVAIDPVDRLEELTYNDKMNTFLTKNYFRGFRLSIVCIKSETYNNCRFQSWWLSSFLCSTSKSAYFRECVVNVWIRTLEKDDYENTIPWIENQILSIDSNTTHLHSYIAVGELENEPLLTANKRLYKALEEKKYQTIYEEFQGGHDSVWWREKLFDGLRVLELTKQH